MFKKILGVLKFTFENMPNIGFWIALWIGFQGWYSSQPWPIKLILASGLFASLVVSTLTVVRKADKAAWKSLAETTLAPKKAHSTDPVKTLSDEVPTASSLTSLYKYASNYASAWAKDAKLQKIVYYIYLKGGKVSKRAQIFIQSDNRSEKLTTYLPRFSDDDIEELSGRNDYRYDTPVPHIHSFKNWNGGIKTAIEKCSADIAKSESMRVQLSPSSTVLGVTLYFEFGNRKWRKSFNITKEGKLERLDH